MHHSEQKCAHFCSEWSIVGYGTGALWDYELVQLLLSSTKQPLNWFPNTWISWLHFVKVCDEHKAIMLISWQKVCHGNWLPASAWSSLDVSDAAELTISSASYNLLHLLWEVFYSSIGTDRIWDSAAVTFTEKWLNVLSLEVRIYWYLDFTLCSLHFHRQDIDHRPICRL